MSFQKLPELGYAYDALEPFIDARTMEIHHSKHHQAYVTNVNAALEKAPRIQEVSLERLVGDLASVPEELRAAVRNNGGGHLNHSFFWPLLKKDADPAPVGDLGTAIKNELSGFESFKETFAKAAVTRFGSGWAWLSLDRGGQLKVHSTPNQDSPLSEGLRPVLGLDVWEHAYYLKYQNRRPDYVSAFWNVVNWERANENYLKAREG